MPKRSLFDIADIEKAKEGKKKIAWAGQKMKVLSLLGKKFSKEKPYKGVTIGACLHVTSETANLVLALVTGGAKVALCASNPLSTQDDVAASLVKDYAVPVYAIHGEDNKTYYQHIEQVFSHQPNITMDDGGDLINSLHEKFKIQNSRQRRGSPRAAKFKITRLDSAKRAVQNSKLKEWIFLGSSEETTTGVIRLKAMERERALKVPVIAVNDSETKYLFDNRYGTGQSTVDGILRSTNILLAGKRVVICGYGWCGRGIATRMRGMGAHVTVCEVDPVKSLEAVMDGFSVDKIGNAVKYGDLFITATGDKAVIRLSHMKKMKDGAILVNSGHFNVEFDYQGLKKVAKKKRVLRPNLEEFILGKKKIYALGEGRLINLVGAEGHPAEVMDLSFANQALAAEFLIKNKGKLQNKVYRLPAKIDHQVARLKLESMGISFDRLTREQRKYLSSWQEGT